MNNYAPNFFYQLKDPTEFTNGIQHALNQIKNPGGIFIGDNLFTYHRNLSFLENKKLMTAFQQHATTPVEQSLLWRCSVVAWAARNGMRLEGDFVEIACYKGTTARIVCDYIDLQAHPERHYYLYDLFEHDPGDPHHAMPCQNMAATSMPA